MIRKRYNTRKKITAQRLILASKVFATLVIISLIVWGAEKIKASDILKTEIKWQIDKNLPIDYSTLKAIALPLTKGRYLLDLVEIKQALEAEPWVATAEVKRLFFDTIQINIVAQKIAMRWQDVACKVKDTSGCLGYISTKGVLFIPNKIVDSNTLLAHSKANQKAVNELYKDYQVYQTIAGDKKIKAFSKTHIDKLIFHPNITVILGYQQKQARLKRFLKVYKKLRKSIAKAKLNRASFDMRYPKAFTLKL
ncbi:hypothetical protein MNB_SUP05-SYMBIONT-4-807 [hydrothermal vent metagenome]|uniref:Uncharacterized protein n=1 Tax=hydrothermal vent metagenome TaxID=652676 RepID=A0A1W1E208_9ZZZZ